MDSADYDLIVGFLESRGLALDRRQPDDIQTFSVNGGRRLVARRLDPAIAPAGAPDVELEAARAAQIPRCRFYIPGLLP